MSKDNRYRNFEICKFMEQGMGYTPADDDFIRNVLESQKQIKKWAYIWHDKDVKTVNGSQIPVNTHADIVICCPDKATSAKVADWFNVNENFVHVLHRERGFTNYIPYLIHDTDKAKADGKHLYAVDEVKSNFEFKEELERINERKSKFGKDVNDRDYLRDLVLNEGVSIRQIIRDYRLQYLNDDVTLNRFRKQYLSNAPVPTMRLNFYICGDGGTGKGVCCRILARALATAFLDFDANATDDEIFFTAGSKKTSLDGYDGQPIIIWNDRRHTDLLEEFGDRGNLFNAFDTHPQRTYQNVKYGTANMINTFNIVNGIEPFDKFLDGLAGDEDKTQSYRRFPLIMPLREEYFDIMINRGFLENNRNFLEYKIFHNIFGSFAHIARTLGETDNGRDIALKTIAPAIEQSKYLIQDATPEESPDLSEFEFYGKQNCLKLKPTDERISGGFLDGDGFEEIINGDEQQSLLPPPSNRKSSDEIYCRY